MNRFLRYAAVGAAATGVHWAVLVLCVRGLTWPAVVGSGIGAAAGAQVAFFGNRAVTFTDHVGRVGPAWRKFQATAVLGAVFGMAVVGAGVALGLHYLLAQAIATALGLVLTFAVNRVWTFGAAPSRSAPPATSPAPPP